MTTEYSVIPDGGKIALSLASTGRLYRPNASIGLLLPGANDFQMGFWVYFTDLTTDAGSRIASVYTSSGDQRSWALYYGRTAGRLFFLVNGSGASGGNVTVRADNFGAISTGIWYFIEAGVVGGNAFIRVNRGTADTTAFASSIYAGSADFIVGGWEGSTNEFRGRIDEAYFWVDSGVYGLPTSGELDSIYNSGGGISWGEYLDLELTAPYSAWSFEEPSGTRFDRIGDKNLTATGTVNTTAGLVDTADYTSLQAAWAGVAGVHNGTEAYNLLCYPGGDLLQGSSYSLGGVTADSDSIVTIKNSPFYSHGGNASSGPVLESALTVSNVSYFAIEGLRVESLLTFDGSGNGVLDSIEVRKGLFNGAGLLFEASGTDSGFSNVAVENNLITPASGQSGLAISLTADGVAAVTFEGVVQQNTILDGGGTSTGISLVGSEPGAQECTLDLDLYNNIVIGFDTDIGTPSGITNVTLDSQQNITSDSTGEITGETQSGVFTEAGSNYRPLLNGPAHRTGIPTTAGDDILGLSRSASPDIGAFENPVGVASDSTLGCVYNGLCLGAYDD